MLERIKINFEFPPSMWISDKKNLFKDDKNSPTDNYTQLHSHERDTVELGHIDTLVCTSTHSFRREKLYISRITFENQ